MNIQFIVKPEATGTYNGRTYKGLVVATLGKKKGTAHTYLPDSFDLAKGQAIATYRLHSKLSKAKETRLKDEFRQVDKRICMLMDRMEVLSGRIEKEVSKQNTFAFCLQDVIEEL